MSKSACGVVRYFTIAFALLTVCQLSAVSTPFDDALKQGQDLFDQEDFKGAIVALDKAIELNPKSADAYASRADAKFHAGQDSFEDANKAISLDQNNEYGYSCRADAYEQKGDHQKAIDDFSQAVILNPEYDYVFRARGAIYSDLGQYEKAIDDYTNDIELRPSDAYTYLARAHAYAKIGQGDKATNDGIKAIFYLLWQSLVASGPFGMIIVGALFLFVVFVIVMLISRDSAKASWRDFGNYLPVVWLSLSESKGMTFWLLGCTCLATVFPRASFIAIAAIYPAIFLSAKILQNSLRNKDVQSEFVDKIQLPVGTIFLINLIYGWVAIILMVFLVVPGIWWMARYSLAVVAAVAEGKGPLASLSTSSSLTKGHVWQVLHYMHAPIFLFFFSSVFSLIVLIAVSVLSLNYNQFVPMMPRILFNLINMIIQFGTLPMLVHQYLSLNGNRLPAAENR
ncbi:MAG: tetratricopeptide repeat protein [Candidatus Obscuribacterales bacterium]|nr:tetratricopeptide repeat protein [Candidatus Obscuribacterales bacterium]